LKDFGETMNIIQSFLLGILQGLTEFIPVSSTAHLLIGQKILGIASNDAMFSYLVLVQLGTILSLIVYFWKDLWKILLAALSSIKYLSARNTNKIDLNARLGWFIIIATIPALVFGFLLKSAVETLFKTPLLEAGIRLVITAVILGLAEWLGRRNRSIEKMNGLDALFVGLAQVLSVFPGASRSGTTIGAGMARGLDRPSAARFAFLMSVPVMLAAGGYQSLELLKMSGLATFLPVLAVGFATAAFVGWLAIKWLLAYLNKHSLYIFAGYCAIVGVVILVIQFAK
jgi:undecaprenyl-diphosphatase